MYGHMDSYFIRTSHGIIYMCAYTDLSYFDLNNSFQSQMASQILKKTTGLTGLAVSKDPHHSLTTLYHKILRSLEKIPDQSKYKEHTKKLTEQRLHIVNTEKNISKLEEKINAGQIEEVIKQAEYELVLAKKMIDYKAWEPLLSNYPANQFKWPL
jgi:NADH dehydrogenase (ubiquinone) 1 alpha subcomplex subunit 5